MKTYDTFANGDRLVALTPEEWDGLATAVEIAFEDEEVIPDGLRPIAARLWEAFHPRSLRTLVTASEVPVPAGWSREDTGGSCSALLQEVDGFEVRITDGDDPSIPDQRESDSFALCVYLPGQSEPVFESLHATLDHALRSVDGAIASARVARHGGPRYVRLAIDDDEAHTAPFFPFDESGSYLAVYEGTLYSVPMQADLRPSAGDVPAEVVNIEGLDLAVVNNFFGTFFRPEQFPGR